MKLNSLIPELAVSDFNKSINFYVNVFGFSIIYQRKEEGFAMLSLGKSQIMIDEISKDRTWQTGEFEHPLGRGINLQIEVEKITPIINRLKKNNIKIFMEVEEKWYRQDKKMVGNRQFLVQDLDGYLLRFFEDLGYKNA